ncbi:hypothetical protein SAMN06265365_1294 [Tistlia consotensis]|uniref:LTXXQ motif family protein n=1 Tax=Tistlia consotensis USBA 355 TaxID=560819 RepID=A0A1Y6CLL0_9PROT|nr:hypothetical protein [Tistlia consotensis]SMF75734.1 hypothetical protein SAMN05428998_13462 [Tistlia consotensis USBA 355]SNS07485.1 hypothetical protein SAMN06265365_1294 [Tistlia consotensis]
MPLPPAIRALAAAVALALAGGAAAAGEPVMPRPPAGLPGAIRAEAPDRGSESLEDQAARLAERLREDLSRLDQRLRGASEETKRRLLEERGVLQKLQEELTRRLAQLAEQSSEAWRAGARIFLDAVERFLDGLDRDGQTPPERPTPPPQVQET